MTGSTLAEAPVTTTSGERTARPGIVALWVFACVPAGLALLTAVRAPRAHVLLDYWHVLAKVTDDAGGLQLGQVFTYHLDQPFVLPSLLFWADAAWFGGDNRVLTVVTVVLVAGIVLLLRSMLPSSLSPLTKAALTAGFSWLLLTSHAAELWLQGTNGISWIPAVFCCVLALALHRRPWLSYAAAALGCLSFGAALPIWFVLALVAWLRRDSRPRILVPLIIGVLVLGGWYLTRPSGPQSLATSAFDPDGRLSVAAAALGGLWSADNATLAVIAGGLTAALLALLWRREFAVWNGVAAYAVALAVMLALGRTTGQVPGGNVGLISRYVVVAALATSALLVLIAVRRPPSRPFVVGVITVALVTHAIGGVKAGNVRGGYHPLELAPIALRVEAPEVLRSLHIQPEVIPAARALHAYPFTDGFSLGCGGPELGGTVSLGTGEVRGAVTSQVRGDFPLTGWATVDGAVPDCVVVTDGGGIVVGAGVTALPRPTPEAPESTGWQAVAPASATGLTVLAVKSGRAYPLPVRAASSP